MDLRLMTWQVVSPMLLSGGEGRDILMKCSKQLSAAANVLSVLEPSLSSVSRR